MAGTYQTHMTVSFVQLTARQVKSRSTSTNNTNQQKKKVAKIIMDQEEELIVCTHDFIQHLKPEKYLTDNDKKELDSK